MASCIRSGVRSVVFCSQSPNSKCKQQIPAAIRSPAHSAASDSETGYRVRKSAKKKAIKGTAVRPGKKAPAKKAKKAVGEQHPQVYYRLHALLHTVRVIGQYEDQLCTLLHEMKSTGAVDRKLHRELLGILDEMPSLAYQADLQTVRAELGGTGIKLH